MGRRGILYKRGNDWCKTYRPNEIPDGTKFRILRSYHEYYDQWEAWMTNGVERPPDNVIYIEVSGTVDFVVNLKNKKFLESFGYET